MGLLRWYMGWGGVENSTTKLDFPKTSQTYTTSKEMIRHVISKHNHLQKELIVTSTIHNSNRDHPSSKKENLQGRELKPDQA